MLRNRSSRRTRTDYHRKVVNISSASGVFGSAGQANYASAKAGLIGLTKTLAKEWGRYRVNVNAVAYGWILTRMTEAVVGHGAAFVEIEGRKIKVGVSEQFAATAAASIPLGRPGTPQEAAGAVYVLCSPDSDYISGQCVNVNGGKA